MKGALPVLLLLTASGVQEDMFDRTVAALASGSAAEHDRDGTRRDLAATELRASGATPAAGSEDIARRWSQPIRRARSPAYRDRALGPAYQVVMLAGHGLWRAEQTFLAGQRARVAVVTAPPGTFTLQVTGDDRATVCLVSQRRCDWVPAYTARFAIEIRNPGSVARRYFVVVQ